MYKAKQGNPKWLSMPLQIILHPSSYLTNNVKMIGALNGSNVKLNPY